VELIYSYPGQRPTIIASIEDGLTGNRHLFQMLLDTGAERTCFPARYAAAFGHDNHHPEVKSHTMHGLGGSCKCYIHRVRLGLIDPAESTAANLVIAWKSKLEHASFADKLDCGFGLLGMDIMSEWSSVAFFGKSTGRQIKIVI
jgi:Aspartyl protease